MKSNEHSSFQPFLRIFRVFRRPPFLCAILMLVPLMLLALAGTTQVAWKGKPVEPRKGWPEGALAMVNDPLRADGWNPWMNDLPNDVDYFEMEARNMEDVNRLIAKLAKIKAPTLQVQLDPGEQAGYIGLATSVKEEKKIAALLAIGDQERRDRWQDYHDRNDPKKDFGSGLEAGKTHSPRISTRTMNPALILYVGHPAIELDRLKIPSNVELKANIPDWYRTRHPDNPNIKKIEQRMRHK